MPRGRVAKRRRITRTKARVTSRRAPARRAPAKRLASRSSARRVATKQPGIFSQVGKSAGGFLGGLLPFPGGSVLGSALGQLGGSMLGKITGLGDYTVKTNSLMGNDPAPVSNTKEMHTIIHHREYLGDVSGSTAFQVTAYPINPGLATSFPWLAPQADMYEEYTMRGLVYEFKSTSATALNSTNTALGTVMMATNYNPANPNFENKRQMENHFFSTSCAPSESAMHPIECDPKQNPFGVQYLRSGAVPEGTDKRLYDIGTFQIATVGMQAAAVIGELWCTYEVEFRKPKLTSLTGTSILTDVFSGNGTGATLSVPLASLVADGQNTLGGTITGGGANYAFPPLLDSGEYLLIYQAVGTAVTAGGMAPAYVNCAGLNIWQGGTQQMLISSATGAATTGYVGILGVKITGPNAVVQLDGMTIPTSPTLIQLCVTQINGQVVA